MQAGQLRDRITISSGTAASSTQSATGVVTFSTFATVWGAVRPSGGNETLAAGSVTSQVAYQIEIRHLPTVTARMRATWTPYRGPATTVEILAVQLHPSNTDRMVLLCGVAQ